MSVTHNNWCSYSCKLETWPVIVRVAIFWLVYACSSNLLQISSYTTSKSINCTCAERTAGQVLNVLNRIHIYKHLKRISNVHYLKCLRWQLLSNWSVIRPSALWALFLYIWVPFFVGLHFVFLLLLHRAVLMSVTLTSRQYQLLSRYQTVCAHQTTFTVVWMLANVVNVKNTVWLFLQL